MSDLIEVYYEEDENGEWYTAIINDVIYQMNHQPAHPQGGFNQHIGMIGQNGYERENFGEEIALEDCPDNIKAAIEERIPREVENQLDTDLF